MAAPFENRKDAQRAYISRREAEPIVDAHELRKSHREHVNNLIFSCDGTRFPGEPRLKILPDVGACLPGKDVLGVDEQKKRNNELDKMREKLDIFGAFGKRKKGKIPGWM